MQKKEWNDFAAEVMLVVETSALEPLSLDEPFCVTDEFALNTTAGGVFWKY